MAALLLNAVRAASGQRLPPPGRTWLHFLALAISGNALPFLLISWGQERVPSGLAGVLMAVMPLATLALAHFAIASERLQRRRVAGFALGFAGVALLIGPGALPVPGAPGAGRLRELAVLGGALCYAVNTVLARRLRPMSPVVAAAGVLLLAAVLSLSLALPFDRPWRLRPSAASWLALLWLGAGPTALATAVHLALVARAGASFSALTNYLIPVIAVAAGAVAFAEVVEPRTVAALGLLLLGIALSRGRRTRS